MTTLARLPEMEDAGARVMASAWIDYHAALWCGDPAASAFAEWLAGYWEPILARPAGQPVARCPLPNGKGKIEWFEHDGWVSGHLPGQQSGYLLPRAIVLVHPWAVLEAPAA